MGRRRRVGARRRNDGDPGRGEPDRYSGARSAFNVCGRPVHNIWSRRHRWVGIHRRRVDHHIGRLLRGCRPCVRAGFRIRSGGSLSAASASGVRIDYVGQLADLGGRVVAWPNRFGRRTSGRRRRSRSGLDRRACLVVATMASTLAAMVRDRSRRRGRSRRSRSCRNTDAPSNRNRDDPSCASRHGRDRPHRPFGWACARDRHDRTGDRAPQRYPRPSGRHTDSDHGVPHQSDPTRPGVGGIART